MTIPGLITAFGDGDAGAVTAPSITASDSIVFGDGSSTTNAGWAGFAVGQGCTIDNPYGAFAQGVNADAYWYGSFAQGYAVKAGGYSFAQGYNLDAGYKTAYSQLVQGQSIYFTTTASTWYNLAQGGGITVDGTGGTFEVQQSIFQGGGITVTGPVLGFAQFRNNIIQGLNISMALGNSSFVENNIIQGNAHVFANPTTGMDNSFIQGYSHDILGSTGNATDLFCQGSQIVVNEAFSASFIQGRLHTVTSSGVLFQNSLVQGTSHTISAQRVFAQGLRCSVTRNDQKTWGSNRAVTGGAQSSKIIKHLQTTNATQTTLITLDLEEDKAYAIDVKVIARNTTTNGENARYSGSFLAYRDTAGTATLEGGTAVLSSVNTGGGSTAWSVDITASTNDILLRATGDAVDTVQWCADFEFVEVLG